MSIHTASLRVSDEERTDAIAIIQAAYADGRLDESALERHLELAFQARTRIELHQATAGLRRPGTPPLFTSAPHPVPAPPRPGVPMRADATAAGLTHLSALPFSFFGPGAVWLCATDGSPLKREAAKALNFQVIAAVASLLAGLAGMVLNVGFLSALVGIAWFILTVVSGVKALRGEPWTNPVTYVVGKRLVKED